jgi:hypothetical protein
LTRDRRGFENTFLLHADHPGAKPRLLYWYRTAPGIVLGRPALDEDAIRTIEESHPDIEFDWPAILALSEVMTPEEEPQAERPPSASARSASARHKKRDRGLRRDDRAEVSRGAVADSPGEVDEPAEPVEPLFEPNPSEPSEPPESAFAREESGELRRDRPSEPSRSGLVDDLAGREVARALRARYAEIKAKIDQREGDRDAWLARVEAINPDAWLTPEAVLHGVSNAGAAYEKLKKELDQ